MNSRIGLIMLTDDNIHTAELVSNQLDIDAFYAELLPVDKVKYVKKLKESGHIVAMAGDGINDAQAIATADNGLAMGGCGTSKPFIIFFRNEGTRIALYPLEELAKDINEDNRPFVANGFPGNTLAYNAKSIAEIDEVLTRVEQARVTIQKKPQKTDWGGYGGYFTDLDGYYWEVAYGSDWEFDESNMLVIKNQ